MDNFQTVCALLILVVSLGSIFLRVLFAIPMSPRFAWWCGFVLFFFMTALIPFGVEYAAMHGPDFMHRRLIYVCDGVRDERIPAGVAASAFILLGLFSSLAGACLYRAEFANDQ